MLAYSYKWTNESTTSVSCAESMDFGMPAIVIMIGGGARLRIRVGSQRQSSMDIICSHTALQVMNDVTEFNDRQAYCVQFFGISA